MSTIYTTRGYKGHGKHETYWNTYEREGDEVVKIKHRRDKFFDGDENNWETSEREVDRWGIDDPDMPDWLQQYL